MANPDFPNVPVAPGVPPVNRGPGNPATQEPPAATQDGASADTAPADPQWGVYDASNAPVVVADSVASLSYSKDYDVSRYPLEGGAFESYNKVEEPYEARVKLTRGGTDADRTEFLTQLDAANKSLDLYSIVMPEGAYLNANVLHVDFERTSERGVSLITAELHLVEIRDTATAAFSNVKVPTSTGQKDTGAVQTQTPPKAAGGGTT